MILSDVLTLPDIMKSFADAQIKTKIKKGETELTKQEVQTLIEETIKKALEKTETVAEPTITSETVQKMVGEAVQKALAPTTTQNEKPLTAETVQEMISEAVTKAIEPVLKQAGVPSNLNMAAAVEKSEPAHFLAGIL